MSTKELRDKAHRAVDAIPDEKLKQFVEVLDQINALLNEAEFDARVKKIIDENRGLLQRLAQ